MNMNVTPDERTVIFRIAVRAMNMADELGYRRELVDWEMDITATHRNGTPLKLKELCDSDNVNFAHDVFGIMRNIDRTTGEITNCFLPRFSQGAPA